MVWARPTYLAASCVLALLVGAAFGCSDSDSDGNSDPSPDPPAGECGSEPCDTRCTFNSECEEPQVCAVDRECRRVCEAERDCEGARLCVHGVCADEEDVTTDGLLTGAVPGAVGPGAPN